MNGDFVHDLKAAELYSSLRVLMDIIDRRSPLL
jgi:hypothetical protein